MTYLWEAYRADKAGKRIVENMEFSGRAVLPFFGHLLPDEVTAEKCRAYARARKKAGRKPGTSWTELNHLQIALNWAHEQRLIPFPIAIERPIKPPPRDRRLTAAESQRLIEAATIPHIRIAIALMLNTGARAGAVLDLTWDRVDLSRGLITFANQALWLVWIIGAGSWGLLPMNLALWAVYGRNHLKWRSPTAIEQRGEG